LGIQNKKLKASQASACWFWVAALPAKLLPIYPGEGEVFMQSTDFYSKFVNKLIRCPQAVTIAL